MADPILLAKTADIELMLLPALANRHGLITGATGTGKTVTMQDLAESFSRLGVPSFMADVKGDFSGISAPGSASPKMKERLAMLKLDEPKWEGCPVTFWDVYGEQGHPVRATISDMGPLLLGRLLNLSDVQQGVLTLVFKIADDNGLALLDLKDLRAMSQFVGDNAAKFKTAYGNVSTASIGAIQRGLLELEHQIHHAAIDLSGGAEITTLLHDTTAAAPPPDPPEPWFPQSPPGSLSLLARAAIHNVVQPFEMAGPLMRSLKRFGPVMLGAISDAFLHPERQPVTRFNAEVSPHRVFETRRFLLEEFRQIRQLVDGASINDVVLAVCGGALRRYLLVHDELPPASLVAIAPISIRHADSTAVRSSVSMMRVPLGTDIAEPIERLRHVRGHTSNAHEMEHAVGARELTDLSQHAPARTLATTARLLSGASLGVGQHAPLTSRPSG